VTDDLDVGRVDFDLRDLTGGVILDEDRLHDSLAAITKHDSESLTIDELLGALGEHAEQRPGIMLPRKGRQRLDQQVDSP
jgi:hypothetical protein